MSKLNVRQIYTDRTRATEIETVLEYWRGKYKQLAAQKEDPEIKKELTYIETQANELKAELSQYQPVPTISQLCQVSEDDLLANVTLLILDMDEDFNVGKGLSVSQVETLAFTITTTYKSLTLEDVALCFHRAKLGHYGEVYDRLDLNVVNSWLNQYSTEVKQVHQAHTDSAHILTKSGIGYGRVSDRTESGFKEFKHEYDKSKLVKQVRTQRKINKSKRN